MRAVRHLWILALGWIAFLVIAFPGLLTRDSIDQLLESRRGFYTDSHPPLMALVWRVAELIVEGPVAILVVQTGMLVAGLYLVFARFTRPAIAAACAVGVLWFPPVSAPMVVIWKDSLMAGACILGLGLMLYERRSAQLGGLALLGFGAALRYNGLALTLPIVVGLFLWRPMARAWQRYAIAFIAWIATTGAGVGCNKLITDREMHFWVSSGAIMDIAGTLCFETRSYSDDELKKLFAGTDLRIDHDIEARMCNLFERSTHARLTHPTYGIWSTTIAGTTPTPKARRDAFARVWSEVVPSRPFAYLKYRITVFSRVIGITGNPWGMTTPRTPPALRDTGNEIAKLDLFTDSLAIQRGWTAAITWLAESTPLFQPWLYLVLALVLLVAVRRRPIAVLVLSGLAYEGTLFLGATSPDFRYSHWMILTTCTALVVWALQRNHRVPRRDG